VKTWVPTKVPISEISSAPNNYATQRIQLTVEKGTVYPVIAFNTFGHGLLLHGWFKAVCAPLPVARRLCAVLGGEKDRGVGEELKSLTRSISGN